MSSPSRHTRWNCDWSSDICFFFQAEDGIRDGTVTGVQTCALPICNNLALAIPDVLKQHPEYTKAQLGTAMTGLALAYGLSKFIMGSVSDRSNPRWFMRSEERRVGKSVDLGGRRRNRKKK